MQQGQRPWTDPNVAPTITWKGGSVDCWTCGTGITPVTRLLHGFNMWVMPVHAAFAGWAPGLCGGSGRMIGPVLP